MRIWVERREAANERPIMDALSTALGKLGHDVTRKDGDRYEFGVIWNGRRRFVNGAKLVVEQGWLPRWWYQITPDGINGAHHLAKPDLSEVDEEPGGHFLSDLRASASTLKYRYMDHLQPAQGDVREPFLLVPLQMPNDVNVEHAPESLQNPQDLVDWVSSREWPFKVVFRRHPAEKKNRLKLKFPDGATIAGWGLPIHSWLKSPYCKGLISVNSNTVHDAMIWGVRSGVLGEHMWPMVEGGPVFPLKALRPAIKRFLSWLEEEDFTEVRRYATFLRGAQWKPDDLEGEEGLVKLGELVDLSVKKHRTRARVAPRPFVNVYCENRSWLFEDLKEHLERAGETLGVEVRATEFPQIDAGAWIAIRTDESVASPKPWKTIVQYHDLWPHPIADPVLRAGARAALCNPEQHRMLLGTVGSELLRVAVNRPLGAPKCFGDVRRSLGSNYLRVGWVGRPVNYKGDEVRQPDVLLRAVSKLAGGGIHVHIDFIGPHLRRHAEEINKVSSADHFELTEVACGPDLPGESLLQNRLRALAHITASWDAAIITSKLEAGPLPLFQALAAGVPVLSTPCGWAPRLIVEGVNGHIIDGQTPNILSASLAAGLRDIHKRRQFWVEQAPKIREAFGDCWLEDWARENIAAAHELMKEKD